MKRILLFAIAAMFTTSIAVAQDLSLENLAGPNGMYLRKGASANLSFKVVNNGSTSVPPATVLTIGTQFDNDPPVNISYAIQNGLAPAEERFLTFNPTFATHALGPIKICLWISYGPDGNKSNDTSCGNFEIVTYKRDIGITAIPIPLPNADVDRKGSYSFSFTIKNFSDSSISIGTFIPYRVKVGTAVTQDFAVALTTDLFAKSEATYSTPVFTLGTGVPLGQTQVCFSTLWGSTNVDAFPANDETCNTYNVTEGTGILENNFTGAVNIQPNPLSGLAQISYTLNAPSQVVLKILSINGQEVKTLVNEKQVSGYHTIEFDASDLEKGLYIYRLQSGNATKTGKLVLE